MPEPFPNKKEVAAIKTLFLEEQRRHYDENLTLDDILDRGCVYDTNASRLVFEQVLDNLEKLRKRINHG